MKHYEIRIEIGHAGVIYINQDAETFDTRGAEAQQYCEGLNYDELIDALVNGNYIVKCEVCQERWARKNIHSNKPDCCDECETN